MSHAGLDLIESITNKGIKQTAIHIEPTNLFYLFFHSSTLEYSKYFLI